MTDDLARRLADAAGPAGPAPDLGGLWVRGRRRRQRRQALIGLGAAAAVVVLLAAGAVLAGSGGGDDGVVAGPGGSSVPPPSEPADLPVRMTVEAGSPIDGVPTFVPGDVVMIGYVGLGSGEWMRGVSVDWEVWDGSSWDHTHTLVLGNESDGSDGQVVPVGGDLLVKAAGMSGPGPDPFPTPSDLGPGWYRVCAEMSMHGGESDPSEVPPGVSSSVPPPSSEVDSSPGSVLEDPAAGGGSPPRTIRPCAQVRVT